jgi:hypothetical protein
MNGKTDSDSDPDTRGMTSNAIFMQSGGAPAHEETFALNRQQSMRASTIPEQEA